MTTEIVSDTPETDAASCYDVTFDSPSNAIEFARRLERERNRLAEVVASRDADRAYNDKKWNELREHRDLLAEALLQSDMLLAACGYTPADKARLAISEALAGVNPPE